MPAFLVVPYNDIWALKAALEAVSPILWHYGGADSGVRPGVVVPDQWISTPVPRLLHKHNALLICDEVRWVRTASCTRCVEIGLSEEVECRFSALFLDCCVRDGSALFYAIHCCDSAYALLCAIAATLSCTAAVEIS
jgi:hypothetical protein